MSVAIPLREKMDVEFMKGKRWLLVLISALVIFTLGCGFFTKLFQRDSTALSSEPPKLAAPPKPASVIKGTPEEQAVYFADQLASPETRLAGWLGLYDALRIPVIGQDGKSLGTTGDDPIGPQYWEIWYSSGLDKNGRGVPISDAGRILGVASPEFDGGTLGATLLKDLKLAAENPDPQVQLFGMFVRERIKRGPSHVDIRNADAVPDKAIIDSTTLQMIAWLAIRNALLQSARSVAATTRNVGREYRFAALLQSQRGLTSATPCSEIIGGSYQATYWAEWILKKVIARGVQLPGMEKAIPGLVERLLNSLAKGIEAKRAAEMVGNVRTAAAWLNAVTSALTLVMRLLSMEISASQDPDPLIRTKGTSNGKEGKVTFALSLNPKNPTSNPDVDPDGNSLDNCLGSFLASAAGITLKLPPAGRVSGSELDFKGGMGFPDLVLFADYKDLFGRDTNSNGEVSIQLTGVAQKKQLPENSRPIDKEFSIHVSAQPEAYNGNTIANMFYNGLTFGVRPNAPSGISAIVDVLKTVHYDMGEHVFRLTDWQPRGYRASGSDGPVVYSGVICSLDQPFTVTGKHPLYPLPLNFTPSSPTTGTMSYGTSGSGISASGGGTYRIDGATTDAPVIVINTKSTASVPVITTSGGGKATIFLLPLETGECN